MKRLLDIRVAVPVATLAAVILLPYLAPFFTSTRCLLAGGFLVGALYLVTLHGGAMRRAEFVTLRMRDGTRLALLATFAVLLAKLVRDAADLSNYEPRNAVAIDILFQGLVIAVFIALSLQCLSDTTSEPALVLAVAVSVYAAINLLGYALGIQTRLVNPAESLSGRVEGRLIAPFGPGLNNFGMIIAVGFALSVGLLGDTLRQRRATQAVCLAGCALVSGVVIFLVEMRSTVLSLAFGLVWAVLRSARWRAVVGLGACVTMFVLPLAAVSDRLGSALEQLAPTAVFNLMQRTTSDLRTVGGRTYIWSHGFEMILSGNPGPFGLGPRTRDTRDLLDEYLGIATESNTSYHNSVLDTLIVYGYGLGFVGLALNLVVSLSLFRRCWRSRDPSTSRAIQSALLVQSALCLSGVSEAFSSQTMFWAAPILCLSVLAAHEVRQRTASRPAPPRPATRTPLPTPSAPAVHS